jgi:hypothetical protein
LSPNYTGVASSLFGLIRNSLAGIAVQIMGYVPAAGWQPALWFCAIGAAVSCIGVLRLEADDVSAMRT